MIALFTALPLLLQEPFTETRLSIPKEGAGLLLRDLTGDGALDLVRADAQGLALLPLGPDRRYPAGPSARLAWPAGRVGWELADLDGDGTTEVLFLTEDRGVLVHRFEAGTGFDEGQTILEQTALLPTGVSRVHFVRDVDGDGLQDLVLPGSGSHRVFRARGTDWAPPIEVAFELRSSLQAGDPERLDSSFGQQVRVPWFRIEDVDGDGSEDLVSETSERIAFHLAAPELSSEPTWTLDLEALRAELPQRTEIDFDNLLSMLDQRVTWQVSDIDGEAPDDLVVQLGSKLRIYLGGARTGPQGTPDQVLKASGNVLLTFLRPTRDDALPDLQILRAERIPVSRVIRSLLFASDLDFDIFTYGNEAGTFSRKPTRRNRITLKIPRLVDFMDESDDGFAAELEDQFDLPTLRFPRVPGSPAAGDDVLDLLDGELVVFEACAPEPSFLESLEDAEEFEPGRFVEGVFLREFDTQADGASRTLDFGDLETFDFAPSAVLRQSTQGQEPARRHPLAVEPDDVHDLLVRDLDGDGTSDAIVVGETDDTWVLQFLVSNATEEPAPASGSPQTPQGG